MAIFVDNILHPYGILHRSIVNIIFFQFSMLSSDIPTIVKGSTRPSLSQQLNTNNVNQNRIINHTNIDAKALERIYPVEERWQAVTALPIPLLPITEGMSARSHHRVRQSASGLDNADMELQATQLDSHAGLEEVSSSTTNVSWINRNLSFSIIVCAVTGAFIFTLLFLLWLRKQMSSERKSGDCDRRGLVEEGVARSLTQENKTKMTKRQEQKGSPIEAQWVHQPFVKIPKETICRSSSECTSSLPEVIRSVSTPERRIEPIRVKTKGLLERRGSSASLTIELAPAITVPDSPLHMVVTPTRECTSEEFLLSAGNVLSRGQLRRTVKDPFSLHKEFWEVPLNLPEKFDVFGAGLKNRYSGVLPNSQSRVILMGIDDPVGSYINANYIKGYDGEESRYIATQGPLANTVTDFWQMVWMDKVSAVVMMTRLQEASKTKCDIYFPLEINDRIQSGPFTILVTSIVNRDGFTIRDIELINDSERRSVTHYWYDSWPDHAVPQAADSLVSLAAEINTLPGPIVVHCSAGIGRTGCFIALATGMIQLTRDGNVDVLGILCQMRYDRGGMIQTAEQYEFVHKALCLFEQALDGKMPTSGD